MTTKEITTLVKAGCNITVSVEKFTYNEVRLLARTAKSSGAMVTIHDSGIFTFNELLLLANEADGHITLTNVKVG